MYYKINLNAIKKLKKPVDEGWAELNDKNDIGNLETGDGFL